MSEQFIKLCDFKIDHQDLKLLYRGSRDGFRASNFHSQCDNQANTITVIETTSGFIFGGYTQASWTSNEQYSKDANAFLFSLVNPFKKPFLSKICTPKFAIFNDPTYGPIFSGGICICNNSNTSANSLIYYSTNYQRPNEINDPNGLYFVDKKHFSVKEIEVFKI